jgi:hypothetical protein
MEKITIPDQYFWYTLATLLSLALIWVLIRYTGKIDTILIELKLSVNELVTITKVHEAEISHIKEDVKTLREESKVVKYRSGK